MRRAVYLLTGALGYGLAIVPMAYFVGFVGGFGVPHRIDSGVVGAPGAAAAIDFALLASFFLVHSTLARPAWRRRLLRLVPADLERSVYSAVAGAQIALLVLLWRPLPATVWSVAPEAARAAVWGLYALGWAIVVWALASIRSSHLFGLRSAWAAARGEMYSPPGIRAAGPYVYLRHPLYAGTLLALFAAPDMSLGHLMLAAAFAAYIAVGTRLEERDLAREHGGAYAAYRASLPGFFPRFGRRLDRRAQS